ncbi:DUF6931 family protein [Vibrio rotiferianus]|uniref:DUF6931 family protein n=1 Tax=Vibrio rotiferianus TaxID=190895 RepID=UPI00406A609F
MKYKKIPYQTAEQILPRFQASDEAKALLDEETSINDVIQSLTDKELFNDLVQFLTHALPVREAIWWGALCLNQRNEEWSPLQKQSVDTCMAWVRSPSEELRRKAEHLSHRLELNCGPSWLAQAVFWNGSGSIVAPDIPPVMPDPFLYAKATAGAINHAAALPQWDKTKPYYQTAIAMALDIAAGGQGASSNQSQTAEQGEVR